ncbi:MAG TPA: amino acid adenylation domain-containing protein, partial [Thermoanaerobaculia bacterium]|nr:amino acid adenylation domain-containing protein [Thermoanaerobaculia bacterium]
MIESSKRLASLSPEKRRLLLKLLQKEAELTEGERDIPRRADDGPAPLSFSQQRLWFLDRLTPGSPAYNLFSAVRLRGALRVEALRRALNEIVRRHEVLRVRFEAVGDQPVQVVAPALEIALPLVDLGEVAEVEALALEEARRPFDLARVPLLRAILLRRRTTEHVLLFTMHHAVSDGWSIGVLIRELGILYEAFAAALPSPLPELPLQFPDYAVWQRDWLQGEALEKQLDWWRAELAGAPAVLELPTDRPRPSTQSFLGATRLRALESFLPASLEGLTEGGESTLFMVLLAAFHLLLGRYSRQDDVLVGSPIAHRTRPGLEALIGFFANTLVFRGRLDGAPTFAGLLARTRETTLGAFEHQDLPFELLVDELGLERSLSHTPLFQVVLVLQNAPAAEPESSGGVAISPLPLDTGTAKFDLTLTVVDQGTGWLMGVEHRTDLFDGSTIERLMGHFETLLAGAAADPQASIWELPLLGEAERRQLVEWGGAVESYPLSGSLHGRFEAWAKRTPDAVAVTFGDESLCYGELDRRANRLAHRLLAAGVKPGSRVCLAVERGFGLVEGILGILKAGCAYVPLDPSYPQERLAWIQEDAGAAAALTPLGEESGELWEIKSASPSPLSRGAGGRLGEGGQGGEGPDWPAYVIYTSGSTGRPKGVVVTHGNVLRLMASTEEWFGFGRQDVWTLFHSFAFDFSVWELWGPLLYGGRLVVVPYLVSRSPEAMLELLDREGVTVLNQTPSAFRALQQVESDGGRSVRWVVFGGEALEPRSLESWWRRHDTGLVNMYGITETTVHVTYRRLGEAEILGGGGSVIGVPLRDLSIHVLDAAGNPVPIGVAGEMYVGGAGVALGYLNRPELTAERFVPDQLGARLYRSGDLGRWRASGELEYLGRIDHQVKVRGFRIELGEIESVLSQKPGVEAAVVLVREDTPGDKRLVAYVVGEAEGLRGWVKDRLPEYMVPAAFVALEALPLTPNGKVDRKALPTPGLDRAESGYVAPRTEEEEVLAAVWSQVLGLDRVGVEDNFFALGGDSILSLRVVALAGERGLAIALPDLFQHQTLAELAAAIRTTPSEAVRSKPFSLISAEDRAKLPEDVEDAYPLATLQAGML